MVILTPCEWGDYELLDSGNGKRLERFGSYVLERPDPQALWQPLENENKWATADAVFEKSQGDKGKWQHKKPMPQEWLMHYKDLSFYAKLSPFKHTGVFPEQAIQWDFIQEKIKNEQKPLNILNLFGYTGIATLAAAQAGVHVTHVDASKSTIAWARENQKASGLLDKSIRWILDDALKFTSREVKRSVFYDGIIMDPPIYGHGPQGELWDFNKHFPELLKVCKQLLSINPLFILINAYAISASSIMLNNMLSDMTNNTGRIEYGELALQRKSHDRMVSTGIFARWSSKP